MKPLPFTCILRLNKPQMQENGYRDEVIQNIFDLTLEYMANESYSLSYPELAVPYIINLKHSRFMETERQKINFTLKDTQLITAWEATLKNKDHRCWCIITTRSRPLSQEKCQAIQSDNINDYDIPSIKRKLPGTEKPAQDGPVEQFPSDDENEDSEVELQPKPKKAKKEKKSVEIVADVEEDDDFNDEGVDLDLDDW